MPAITATWPALASLPAPRALDGLSAPVPPFHPLADAVAGEWAVYAAMGSQQIRYEIVKAGVAIIRTQVRVISHGKPLGQPTLQEDQRDTDPLARQSGARLTDRDRQARHTMTRTTLSAAGRTWNAMLYEDRWIDEEVHYVRRTWVSPDVPVFGIVRMELHGDDRLEAQLELTAFGRRD